MSKVKVQSYKGVDIYVTPKGEFYCDALNNSSDYESKTFQSRKMEALEKAIDQFEDGVKDGPILYDADFRPVKVIRKVGSRVFFENGMDTSRWEYNRRPFYSLVTAQTEKFQKILELKELQSKNLKELQRIYAEQDRLLKEIKNLSYGLEEVDMSSL